MSLCRPYHFSRDPGGVSGRHFLGAGSSTIDFTISDESLGLNNISISNKCRDRACAPVTIKGRPILKCSEQIAHGP